MTRRRDSVQEPVQSMLARGEEAEEQKGQEMARLAQFLEKYQLGLQIEFQENTGREWTPLRACTDSDWELVSDEEEYEFDGVDDNEED
jgi:hypothetical protein